MALTRKFLSALSVEAEKIDEIINAHAETVDALKEEIAKYKADAEMLPSVQKELKELKDAQAKAGENGNAFEVKYKAIKEEFQKYKADIEAKETKASKENAYKELLKKAGVNEKRIDAVLKVSGDAIDKLELEEDGKVKGSDELVKSIQTEWEDFIVKEQKQGASTATPPNNTGGEKMSKDQILAIKDREERQQAMLENKELFLN